MAAEPAGHRDRALRVVRLGVDAWREPVLFLRADCAVCRSEGFRARSRVAVTIGGHTTVATLLIVTSDVLRPDEAGLSEAAWRHLAAREGDVATFAHPQPVDSLRHVRAKVYGGALDDAAYADVIRDVAAEHYTEVEIAAFVAACAGDGLPRAEVVGLTKAMIAAGEVLRWPAERVLDKHSVGGLPGNRTTPILVAIVAANGLVIPKTSSRAITSPAGTADTMETLAPVDLDLATIRRVVEREGGCIAWGGAIRLSPADDVLIRVERALDVDTEGQLVASVLSKKAAAGATHVVLDMPVGPTAKVRDHAAADRLERELVAVGATIGLDVRVVRSDGAEPVGRGIGPSLEALDVLAVLRSEPHAPRDLRARGLALAGTLLELGGAAPEGRGVALAAETLDSGRALAKFDAIRAAQGGAREPKVAPHRRDVLATASGRVEAMDNRRIARVAKLAGAPAAASAGVRLHVHLGWEVERGAPVLTIHAETPGELEYALEYATRADGFLTIGDGA